ncbi:Rap1a/Tai family immunity protein [Methylophaga sp.]|uniref:Rap1a/Tai family immunity protein n=1 Tax=Methylophaga sp. TaxID=2024840 RepID=UPI003A8D2FE5
MNILRFIFISLIGLPSANALDLSNSQTLLATCTVEDNGYIGFKAAETEIEKVFARGRYERALMSCVSYIQGVSNATSYLGNASFCLPSVSLEDLRSVVVITLKQKYQTEENSIPLILDSLTRNWPCE